MQYEEVNSGHQLTYMDKNSQIPQLLSRALALHQAGNLGDAEALYRAVLASDPKNAEVLPAHLAYNNLGAILQKTRRYDEALTNYNKAIALKPDYAKAYYNRGNALQDLKHYDEALASYEKAIALKPGYAEAHNNRGATLQEIRRFDEALASYGKAMTLEPGYAEAYYNMGNALQEMRRYDEALASYDNALRLKPNHADAYNNQGITLQNMKRYDEALASYEKALALEPDTPYVLGKLLHAQMLLSHWHGMETVFDRLAKGIEAGKPVSSPFALVATPLSMAQQKKCAEIYVKNEFPPAGYFSTDFDNHATAYLMAELFEIHDRSKFEVTAFSFGPSSNDAMRKRLEKAFDRFIDVRTRSDSEIAALAKNLEIDIAIDLKGFTQDARMGIFALRPAPVQVGYLGYPGTMGASYIDYLIADPILIPEEHKRFYTEKIVTLPDSYQVNDSSRKISEKVFTRREMGLPEEGFVFCCFNNSFKITPDVFALWMRLLHEVPGSVLWLLEGNPTSAKNLRAEAGSRGIAEHRLVFAKRMELADHLARHRLADVFLDTFYYNAHTTASDALWAGLPVVTCLGETFAGRVAASLLNAIGLPELITHSREEYEALALELATSPQKLSAIRRRLAQNRTTQPLFDTALFARHIEEAYVKMWERSQTGLLPGDMTIAAERTLKRA